MSERSKNNSGQEAEPSSTKRDELWDDDFYVWIDTLEETSIDKEVMNKLFMDYSKEHQKAYDRVSDTKKYNSPEDETYRRDELENQKKGFVESSDLLRTVYLMEALNSAYFAANEERNVGKNIEGVLKEMVSEKHAQFMELQKRGGFSHSCEVKRQERDALNDMMINFIDMRNYLAECEQEAANDSEMPPEEGDGF